MSAPGGESAPGGGVSSRGAGWVGVWSGGSAPRGVGIWSGGSALGGGSIPACTEADPLPPCEQNE